MRMPARLQPNHRSGCSTRWPSLLVDLHRNGVFWGDCSLANTLFSRDGQVLQAWLVDAETSEIHPRLSDGQRNHDLDILVENVAGGLLDLADPAGAGPGRDFTPLFERGGERGDPVPRAVGRAARRVDLRRRRPVPDRGPDPRGCTTSASRSTRSTSSAGDGDDRLRLKVAVAARRFHAAQLHDLTGLDVGEGQARILLADLRAYQGSTAAAAAVPMRGAALGRRRCMQPGMVRGAPGAGRRRRPGTGVLRPARGALAAQRAGRSRTSATRPRWKRWPGGRCRPDSAARMAIADAPTGQLAALTPAMIDEMNDAPGQPNRRVADVP